MGEYLFSLHIVHFYTITIKKLLGKWKKNPVIENLKFTV